MQSASQALQSAYGTTAEAADLLRGSDTRRQFADAQQAIAQAGGATAAMTKGLPLLGEAFYHHAVCLDTLEASWWHL